MNSAWARTEAGSSRSSGFNFSANSVRPNDEVLAVRDQEVQAADVGRGEHTRSASTLDDRMSSTTQVPPIDIASESKSTASIWRAIQARGQPARVDSVG